MEDHDDGHDDGSDVDDTCRWKYRFSTTNAVEREALRTGLEDERAAQIDVTTVASRFHALVSLHERAYDQRCHLAYSLE